MGISGGLEEANLDVSRASRNSSITPLGGRSMNSNSSEETSCSETSSAISGSSISIFWSIFSVSTWKLAGFLAIASRTGDRESAVGDSESESSTARL
ncbi:hypothetical protein EYF80_035476 [Liparis tanakae]|uniref:Uncharacterized protein n=1 Tax=Liparis tanakae TaxID=230148 RepID=A0A4Z2GLF4_9TELE|nr:hypothetical protein EYF80_035476 [Liparis tanakae]